MTARTGAGANALEFELVSGDCIRMTLTPIGVVGELIRDGVCLTQARFLNFAAAGSWIDAELRVAAGRDAASEVRELFAP